MSRDARRHDGDGVEVRVLQHDLVQALGVRRQAQRLPHLHVVERRVGRVEDDPLRALPLELLDLLAERRVGLRTRDVRADEHRPIDLARLVREYRLGRDVVVEGPYDRVGTRVLSPVVGVLLDRHALLGLPLDQPVVAVRDVAVLGEGPLVAVLVDRVLAHRIRRPRRREVHEERCRTLQGHDERLVIGSLHGHSVGGAFARAEGLRALYWPEGLRVARLRRWVGRALPGVLEVRCLQGLPVRPFEAGAEVERVRKPVRRDRPLLSLTRLDLTSHLIDVRERLEHVLDLLEARAARADARIHRIHDLRGLRKPQGCLRGGPRGTRGSRGRWCTRGHGEYDEQRKRDEFPHLVLLAGIPAPNAGKDTQGWKRRHSDD